jgi:alkylated DNA repair dioxygenase AlkB
MRPFSHGRGDEFHRGSAGPDPRDAAPYPACLPPGLRDESALIDASTEADLATRIQALPFAPFEFRGYVGNRRVVSFGWRHDFARQVLEAADPMPDFLLSLRKTVAAFTGHDPEAIQQALVLEYTGPVWDGAVAGRNLTRSPGFRCSDSARFRLRRKAGAGWERAAVRAAPRSAYLLRGPAPTDWEHSIHPVEALRSSVTFRSFR